MSFMGFILGNLSDFRLIAGTSLFRDFMNQKIIHDSLSIHSKPLSDNLSGGYFITSDGYKAEDLTIIENGVLQTFLLSLYGSKKTGLQRVSNSGGSLIIDNGETPLEKMIQSVGKGVLLSRFSGGSPSDNGDFSGVAKNSFYIENGIIQYPISETMVSGNIVDMFQKVKHISKEEVNFGDEIFPWVQLEGITVS